MSKYLSDQNQLSFIYESGAYASVSGTRQWVGMVQDHSPDENVNTIQIRYQGSTDRNVDAFEDGQKEQTGTFTYFPQDWKFLGFAIGSIAETASAGSHTFTETNTDDRIQTVVGQSLTSFTLEDAKNNGTAGQNFIRTFNGAMVDTMTVTWSQGEVVSADIDYAAQNFIVSSGAVTAVTPATTKPYMFSDFKMQLPSGTTFDNITEATFTISNNLERGNYLNGSKVAKELLPMNRDYELSSTLWMDSSTAKNLYETYFTGGSEFNVLVDSVGKAGSLYITMSGCKMTDMDQPSPVEGVNEQNLTIVPSNVSVVVMDSIADYNAW